ncbi:methyltransferase [Kosmotoga arenicorallina S304]|uniref:Methyltransferase n=1 Tax=Kosmotoga arenicorallina S304 TaxID=1453497 RepID=A0A182C7G6_9BACT|nr:corrinoid protein [Kosmotoga arenicorallina]OAA31553.1 methyltransferase [Kosmotoga arenicorallina S304]
MDILEEIRMGIIETMPAQAKSATEKALSMGYEAKQILNDALIPAMDVVGKLFKEGEYFVPEVLVAAKAMQACMDLIEPLLIGSGVEKLGKAVTGTIEGDLHDIGKNLVGMMLKGAGFDVIDLGVDVTAERFVEAVKREKPNFVMISALLTSTMINMPKVIKALEKEGLRNKVKVLVGGAPVSQSYADEIGADGYAEDSSSAVELVRKFIEEGV